MSVEYNKENLKQITLFGEYVNDRKQGYFIKFEDNKYILYYFKEDQRISRKVLEIAQMVVVKDNIDKKYTFKTITRTCKSVYPFYKVVK